MKSKRNKGFINASLKGIKIIFKSEPRMLFISICFTTLHGLAWVLQVIFAQRFFDQMHSLIRNEISILRALIGLLGMILAYGFVQVMNGVDPCHSRVLELAMRRHVNSLIFKKIDQLDGIDFENPKQLDYINKAVSGGENLLSIALTLTDVIFFYVTYFIFMSGYLFTLKPILSISIIVIFIPSIISYILQISTFKDLEEEVAPLRRECDHYEKRVVDIKETRLLGATSFFNALYQNCLKKLNRLVLKTAIKKNSLSFAMEVLTTIGYGIIIYMIVVFVIRQEISVGAFAAVIASVSALFNFMSEVISERIGWAFENVATVDNFLSFIEEDYPIRDKVIKYQKNDITLKNVTFRYPLTEKNVLSDLSLVIEGGQTVAIVGENGGGKTTLCKLILGLYKPVSGDILYGNESILNARYENHSAIFQNYNQYQFKLKDNVRMSQLDKNVSDELIEDLCEHSGLYLDHEKFVNGVDTMLGRDFDGIELSGGQWQRVAIARGLFRTSNLIVLDEPTSAIDPLEESRLYHDFMKICLNKTSLIVTHRLGSVKIADRIIVLKEGQIVEDGTHDELIIQNGEYKRMFDSQRKWYV